MDGEPVPSPEPTTKGRRRLLISMAVAGALLLGGAGAVLVRGHRHARAERFCTAVGCGDSIAVELPLTLLAERPAEVRVCLGDSCYSGQLKPDDNQPRYPCGGEPPPGTEMLCETGSGWAEVVVQRVMDPLPGASGYPTIRVTVARDGKLVTDHSIRAHFNSFAPNGRVCGPICYGVGLREDGSRLGVVSLETIARHQQGLGS